MPLCTQCSLTNGFGSWPIICELCTMLSAMLIFLDCHDFFPCVALRVWQARGVSALIFNRNQHPDTCQDFTKPANNQILKFSCFIAGFAARCGRSQIFSVHVLHVALWVPSGCSSHWNVSVSFNHPLSALGQSKGWVWSLLAGSSSSGLG